MRSGVGWAAGIVATTALAALVPAAGVASASVTRAKEPAYEETVRLTVDDLQDYWASELPALYGVDYRKIPASRIIAYTSTSRIPRCGPGRVSYKDIAENAFYCNAGKFVAYDDENLFPQLAEQFGDLTIALTLAHEWGHAVQDQAELTGPTIALEQQADCFAGAWVRNVGEGASKLLTLNQGNLDTGLAGFLSFRARRGLIRQQTAPTGVRSTGSARSRRATTMGRNAAPISRTTRRR